MEKKISQKTLNDNIRNKFMALVKESLEQLNEETLLINSNEFAIPTVDENGNDTYLTIKFSVPTGSRDGEPFDGHLEAEIYAEKLAEQARKREEAKLAKERKIAQDKAKREKLAEAKRLREEAQ